MTHFISVDALAEQQETRQDLVILDGTWHLPTAGRDPRAEYLAGHIPGAQFFDIDGVSDTDSDLPHMLPDEVTFGQAASALGIWNDSPIVVYDSYGLFSAARVWWSFRVMGHKDVKILDGGLPAWTAAGNETRSGMEVADVASYTAHIQARRIAGRDDVLSASTHRSMAILDARPAQRFAGTAPEPRAGMRAGHMPGATNVFFKSLLTEEGRMKDKTALKDTFKAAGFTPGDPAITSCGSGVTAAILALALAELGQDDIRLYDGSWAEWGSDPDLPIETTES
ncbi:MAG: 3-mercaptopyruvate sulfurtransferase [Pseudomonadota bacterium]